MIHTIAPNKPTPGPDYLQPTSFLDCDHPAVREFSRSVTEGAQDAVERAVRLFYAVRDRIRYDPFAVRLEREQYVASAVLAACSAYCLPKAILLAAAARASGIPAAIGLSDVVNHLTTDKLKARMGGQTLFIHHGYAVLHVDGRWVKAAPAFNIELCERFHVRPTEFDGRSDAVFQEYDAHDRRHMEYVNDSGVWSDFPFDRVTADFRALYPPSFYSPVESGEQFEDGTNGQATRRVS
ncbi:MAG TPA: transglutaminase family protein [Casimicrobiaceae bacterium]|jgi:transglutaminase-like putative cysteine protease|nr:transglutaminase family protein [Casimicrobiaceae bacterium]